MNPHKIVNRISTCGSLWFIHFAGSRLRDYLMLMLAEGRNANNVGD
jgi:hypothetical protein